MQEQSYVLTIIIICKIVNYYHLHDYYEEGEVEIDLNIYLTEILPSYSGSMSLGAVRSDRWLNRYFHLRLLHFVKTSHRVYFKGENTFFWVVLGLAEFIWSLLATIALFT